MTVKADEVIRLSRSDDVVDAVLLLPVGLINPAAHRAIIVRALQQMLRAMGLSLGWPPLVNAPLATGDGPLG